MICLWTFATSYPEHLIGEYDRERGPDRFIFKQGKKLNAPPPERPRFRFRTKLSRLLKYHNLDNNANVPLVDQQIAKVLRQTCPDDVELIEALISCSDGESEVYSIVNATRRIRGLDHQHSRYTLMRNAPAILGFEEAVYQENCLGSFDVARDEEYLSHMLVSKRLCDALSKYPNIGIQQGTGLLGNTFVKVHI